jgi:peptidoglycan/xylan/chitin deacetylase (PgdA/CDA1 family)
MESRQTMRPHTSSVTLVPDTQRSLAQLRGALSAVATLAGRSPVVAGSIILAYHDVTDLGSTDYQVTPSRFRAHLQWATHLGIEFVPLEDIVRAHLGGVTLDGKAAVVFDDALVGVYRHALPILQELGIPATVFVVTDQLGLAPPWWPGADRVMTEAELLQSAAGGLTMASHTRSHPSLPSLDLVDIEAELRGSKVFLEDLLGQPADLLAYPFGHFDSRTRKVAAEVGYRAAFSFLNGRVEAGLDPYTLPRLTMWQGQDRARLTYHLVRPPASWEQGQLDEVIAAPASAGQP